MQKTLLLFSTKDFTTAQTKQQQLTLMNLQDQQQ